MIHEINKKRLCHGHRHDNLRHVLMFFVYAHNAFFCCIYSMLIPRTLTIYNGVGFEF
jgi:hypothetical protein